MSRIEALKELAAKVEAGLDTAHDHAGAFPSESAGGHCTWHDSHKASGGSLDAAKSLHDAVLPGWEYGYDGTIAWVKLPGLRTSYRHDNRNGYTSRAWLLAILRALIAQEESE